MKDQPVTGGVVSVLQLISVMSVLLAFFGGALAGLSLGAEIVLMVSVAVAAPLTWAAASVVQELRNIAFNTRRIDVTEDGRAGVPSSRGVEASGAR